MIAQKGRVKKIVPVFLDFFAGKRSSGRTVLGLKKTLEPTVFLPNMWGSGVVGRKLLEKNANV
jgi:hypothetical protein